MNTQSWRNMLFSRYCEEIVALLSSMSVTLEGRGEVPADEGMLEAVAVLERVRERGGKVMVIGNGGSAAIAGHMHNDLAKAAGIKALVFHDISMLTAMSNDHGYDAAYEFGIRQWADAGDVMIAISSSGASENMLRAVTAGREAGCFVVTMTGFGAENPLRKNGDVNFYVPAADYGFVETAHAVLAHYLTDMLKAN